MRQVTKFYDGFLWVDPTALSSEIVDTILPSGDAVPDSVFPCRLTTERRRVRDSITGRRVTRDWRIVHFLLWKDGQGSPNMAREEAKAVFIDAKACDADQIIVHGQIALIASSRIDFQQFGVRDIASIPVSA